MTTMLGPGDSILRKYRVERVLGQGGMGYVVAARHADLGELYAIKVMLRNDDHAERFLREARAAAKLKGEHVARVHDVDRSDDGTLFMVMEYLEGTDLKTHLAKLGRLPARDAIAYVIQACDALAEAHEMGIVHRDVKPANLFLTHKRKKNESFIKVLDFGIAKQMQLEPGQDLTKTGSLLGSPLYMSPEQMQHARNVDARTDIWSLGVVLYELVTGKVPFPGDTLTQVVHSVMSTQPAPTQSLVAVPDGLDDVIRRCLRKNPAERFNSVEELSAALEKVWKGEPVENVLVDEMHADTVKVDSLQSQTFGTTDVGSSEPFADKRLPTAEVAEPTTIEPSQFDPRTSEQPTATTLRSAATTSSSTTHLPHRRRDYAVLVASMLATLGLAAIGLRSPTDASVAVSSAPMANSSPSPIPVEETTSTARAVASTEARNTLPAGPSANAVVTSSRPTVPQRTSAAKPTVSAVDQPTSTVIAPSPKPSATDRWRQGPL